MGAVLFVLAMAFQVYAEGIEPNAAFKTPANDFVEEFARKNGGDKTVARCKTGKTPIEVEQCLTRVLAAEPYIFNLADNLKMVAATSLDKYAKDRMFFHAANRPYSDFPTMISRIAACQKISDPEISRQCRSALASKEWAENDKHYREAKAKVRSSAQPLQ